MPKIAISEMLEQIGLKHKYFAAYRTDPVRTLLTSDCIENAKGYYQGGSRYNFENTSVLGFANIFNALYTIKEVFAGTISVSKEKLPELLNSDFINYEKELAEIKKLPKYGNSNEDIKKMAKDLSEYIFNQLNSYKCPDGRWHITPSIIGWVDFVSEGKYVGATPDGRKKAGALADSSGSMQGTDHEGPTEMLISASSLSQIDAVGSCILNILLGKDLFSTQEVRGRLKALFKTYFGLEGMHLQVTVVDKEILEKAIKEPEKYKNLVVRIAGYNDYFTRQSVEIQYEIIKRTQQSFLN